LLWQYFAPLSSTLRQGSSLSASLALYWEMMTATVVNTFVSLILAIAGVDRMEDPQSGLASWVMPFVQGTCFVLDQY
jgi:hypothetical protein